MILRWETWLPMIGLNYIALALSMHWWIASTPRLWHKDQPLASAAYRSLSDAAAWHQNLLMRGQLRTKSLKKFSSHPTFLHFYISSFFFLLVKLDKKSIYKMADNKFFCRMYENEFPKVDDVVMVNVRQIADMGAYVKLVSGWSKQLWNNRLTCVKSSNTETERVWFCSLNYPEDVSVQSKSWFVLAEMKLSLFSESMKKRVNIVYFARAYMCVLYRIVDSPICMWIQPTGYIDLSKRRVTPEDIIKCEEKYNKSKAVHSILRHVAEKNDMPLQDLYEAIGWPLYKKFGHAYDAFKMAIV